jgi:hypothetical protein
MQGPDIAREIWQELKRYINEIDREDAADTLVSVLIDNDIGADDIKSSFKTDSDIKRALNSYLEDEEDADEEYYEDEDEEEH